MIDFSVIEIAEPKAETFSLFKQYASVPDGTRDALLRSILKEAIVAVQNVSGKSLLPCTLKVTASRREDNAPIRLYQNVASIVCVKDGEGNALDYEKDGVYITPLIYTETAEVTYKTAPDLGNVLALQHLAFKLGTAIYDGETSEVCNSILKEAIC